MHSTCSLLILSPLPVSMLRPLLCVAPLPTEKLVHTHTKPSRNHSYRSHSIDKDIQTSTDGLRERENLLLNHDPLLGAQGKCRPETTSTPPWMLPSRNPLLAKAA